jgi:hypothetical protein
LIALIPLIHPFFTPVLYSRYQGSVWHSTIPALAWRPSLQRTRMLSRCRSWYTDFRPRGWWWRMPFSGLLIGISSTRKKLTLHLSQLSFSFLSSCLLPRRTPSCVVVALLELNFIMSCGIDTSDTFTQSRLSPLLPSKLSRLSPIFALSLMLSSESLKIILCHSTKIIWLPSQGWMSALLLCATVSRILGFCSDTSWIRGVCCCTLQSCTFVIDICVSRG